MLRKKNVPCKQWREAVRVKTTKSTRNVKILINFHTKTLRNEKENVCISTQLVVMKLCKLILYSSFCVMIFWALAWV